MKFSSDAYSAHLVPKAFAINSGSARMPFWVLIAFMFDICALCVMRLILFQIRVIGMLFIVFVKLSKLSLLNFIRTKRSLALLFLYEIKLTCFGFDLKFCREVILTLLKGVRVSFHHGAILFCVCVEFFVCGMHLLLCKSFIIAQFNKGNIETEEKI